MDNPRNVLFQADISKNVCGGADIPTPKKQTNDRLFIG